MKNQNQRYHFVLWLLVIAFTLSPISILATEPTQSKEIVSIDDSAITEDVWAGTYPVTVTYRDENGKLLKETVYLTVYDRRTVENIELGEVIDAHDLEINRGFFQRLSDADFLKLTRAHAWNSKDGSPVEITTVQRRVKDEKEGIYELTFSTVQGTAITITVFERDFLNAYVQKESYYFLSKTDEQLHLEGLLFALLMLTTILAFYFICNTQRKGTEIYKLLYQKAKNKRRKD